MTLAATPRRFTIGELARVAGVGVETIRFYERRGLIERPARPAKLGQIEARMVRFVRMRKTLRVLLARCPGRGELGKCSFVEALSAPARRSRGHRHPNRGTRRAAMKTGELTIHGMHCDGCAKTVEALLSAEPGVKAATASYAGGNAKVVFDPAALDLKALAKAVAHAGYQARARG